MGFEITDAFADTKGGSDFFDGVFSCSAQYDNDLHEQSKTEQVIAGTVFIEFSVHFIDYVCGFFQFIFLKMHQGQSRTGNTPGILRKKESEQRQRITIQHRQVKLTGIVNDIDKCQIRSFIVSMDNARMDQQDISGRNGRVFSV